MDKYRKLPQSPGEVVDTSVPCPFCGGEPILDSDQRIGYEEWLDDPDSHAYYYRCKSCAATGGWAKTPAGAVRLWDMRT